MVSMEDAAGGILAMATDTADTAATATARFYGASAADAGADTADADAGSIII